MKRSAPKCKLCGYQADSMSDLFQHKKASHGTSFGPGSHNHKPAKRKTRRVIEQLAESPAERIVSLQAETRKALEDLRADVTQRRTDLRELEGLVERYEGLLFTGNAPSNYGQNYGQQERATTN